LASHTLTISPKFQIAIPKQIREQVGLNPGDRMQVMVYDRRIELIPIEPMINLRGSIPSLQNRTKR
jgi:AbrB family looped-hinge helix DNA binding protein